MNGLHAVKNSNEATDNVNILYPAFQCHLFVESDKRLVTSSKCYYT